MSLNESDLYLKIEKLLKEQVFDCTNMNWSKQLTEIIVKIVLTISLLLLSYPLMIEFDNQLSKLIVGDTETSVYDKPEDDDERKKKLDILYWVRGVIYLFVGVITIMIALDIFRKYKIFILSNIFVSDLLVFFAIFGFTLIFTAISNITWTEFVTNTPFIRFLLLVSIFVGIVFLSNKSRK
jgi:hypothetical protein